MQFFVTFFMIRFLKQNIRADTGFFQFAVIFHRSGGNIDIYAADSTVFVLNTVNGLNTFQHVFNRIVHRVFTRFQRQTLMPHILKSDYFALDILLRQFLRGICLFLAWYGQ